jgi:hypothetical protein
MYIYEAFSYLCDAHSVTVLSVREGVSTGFSEQEHFTGFFMSCQVPR